MSLSDAPEPAENEDIPPFSQNERVTGHAVRDAIVRNYLLTINDFFFFLFFLHVSVNIKFPIRVGMESFFCLISTAFERMILFLPHWSVV